MASDLPQRGWEDRHIREGDIFTKSNDEETNDSCSALFPVVDKMFAFLRRKVKVQPLPSIAESIFCGPRFHSNYNVVYSVADNSLRTGITLITS